MKKISLTQGKYAIVDDEDFEYLSQWKWCVDKTTYGTFIAVRWDKNHKSNMRLHRLVVDAPDGMQVDHINHDTLDNRKKNLRVVTCQQNQQNQKPRSNTTSKFKGVCFRQREQKWIAKISENHKQIHLGYFDTEEEAARVYRKKAKELYGEYRYKQAV